MTTSRHAITVSRMTTDDSTAVQSLDGAITVDAIAVPRLVDGLLDFDVRPVEPFTKRYGQSLDDLTRFVGRPDRAGFVARSGDHIVGCLLMSEHWNRHAWIDGLVIDSGSRRLGAGRLLMAQAEAWTRSQGLPGIMLETQNVNVAACRFYARCGFVLGGVDQRLYRGFDPETIEAALFWYRDLRDMAEQGKRPEPV